MSLSISTTVSRDSPFLGVMDYPQNPKPSCNYSYINEGLDPWTIEFQPSDYLMLDDGFGEDSSSQNMVSSEQVASGSSTGYSGATSRNNSMQVMILMPILDYSTADPLIFS